MARKGPFLSLLLLCSSLLTSECFFFEDSCSYTEDFASSSVQIDANQEKIIGIVPASKSHFAFMLNSNDNVNIKIVSADGTVFDTNDKTETTTVNHHGMTLMNCGVKCEEVKTISVRKTPTPQIFPS